MRDKPAANSAGFLTERMLVETLRAVLLGGFSNIRQPKLLLEFPTNYGIPDVVLYELKANWPQNRQLHILPPNCAYALASFPSRHQIGLADFQEWTGYSRSHARNALIQLERAGYSRRSDQNEAVWIKVKKPKPITKTLVAIEAKLSDWRRALNQATRYLDFAHFSWVVLDRVRASSVYSHIEEFRSRNIGLAMIEPSGCLTILVRPKRRQPKSNVRFWGANVQISLSLDSSVCGNIDL